MPIRYLVFERGICRSDRLTPADFSRLADQTTYLSFRAAVDENYRYHQFWGNMTFGLLALYVGWIKQNWCGFGWLAIGASVVGFIVIETSTAFAAVEAFRIYVARGRAILEGSTNA